MMSKFFSLIVIALLFFPVNGQKKHPKILESPIEETKWKKIRLTGFSFNAPYSIRLLSDQGLDSPFWSDQVEKRLLDVSIGQYVGFQEGLRQELEYQEEKTEIEKAKALICFYKLDESIGNFNFVSRIFLLKKDGAKFNVSMTLYSEELNANDKEIARNIFKSIRLH